MDVVIGRGGAHLAGPIADLQLDTALTAYAGIFPPDAPPARARSWYERLGWRVTRERKPVYAPAGVDDVRYRMDLT